MCIRAHLRAWAGAHELPRLQCGLGLSLSFLICEVRVVMGFPQNGEGWGVRRPLPCGRSCLVGGSHC